MSKLASSAQSERVQSRSKANGTCFKPIASFFIIFFKHLCRRFYRREPKVSAIRSKAVPAESFFLRQPIRSRVLIVHMSPILGTDFGRQTVGCGVRQAQGYRFKANVRNGRLENALYAL